VDDAGRPVDPGPNDSVSSGSSFAAIRRHQPLCPDHPMILRRDLFVLFYAAGATPVIEAICSHREEERVSRQKSATMRRMRRVEARTCWRWSCWRAFFSFRSRVRRRPGGAVLTIVSPIDGAVIANGTPVLVDFRVSTSHSSSGAGGQMGLRTKVTEGLPRRAARRLLTDVEPFSLPLTSGPHTIRIQIVADNGTSLNPDVIASVGVVATRERVQASLASHPFTDPIRIDGHESTCRTDREFTLVEPRGQPNARTKVTCSFCRTSGVPHSVME